MRLPLLLLTASLILGCASAPEAKMSFSQVFKAPEDLRTRKPAKKRAVAVAPPEEQTTRQATTSLELHGALIGFAARARKLRTGSHDEMPAAAVDNWADVTAAVDELLSRRPGETSSYDVIRSRVVLEAELELDVRAYGAVPERVAVSVERRVAQLALRMAQVRRLKVQPRLLQPDFAWPISPVVVTSLFGHRVHPITGTFRAHQGLDLAAAFGQQVFAASTGTVVKAGYHGNHGNHVELLHPGGVITRYSHLSEILVVDGQVVRQGEAVGLAGSTGQSTGVHLHFELWRSGAAVDPLEELGDPAQRPQPLASR